MDFMGPYGECKNPSHNSVTKDSDQRVDSLAKELKRLGLDPERIRWHANCVMQALAANVRPAFEIIDTCRRDNGGVIPLPASLATASQEDPGAGFVAFVPAAGAASRYSQAFLPLLQALDKGLIKDVDESLETLRDAGADSWPLPALIAELIRAKDAGQKLTAAQMKHIAQSLQLPKALMPCVTEGDSFLELKLAEHRALKGLEGQVFVVPPDMESHFRATIAAGATSEASNADSPTGSPEAHIVPQGPSLSTIRFNRDGTPYLDSVGACSPVPAGHGALIELLPGVAQRFLEAHSIFIRNIDNVVGTKDEANAATHQFLTFHTFLLRAIRKARTALARGDFKEAALAVEPLRSQFLDPTSPAFSPAQSKLFSIEDPNIRLLWDVQARFFHSPLPDDLNVKALKNVYDRPVNTLGQVPNTGKDIGGTPCFIRVGDKAVKICIEVPHASEQDKVAFLSNPAKATHFNPVFAAAELIDEERLDRLREHGFWILSEKNHKGHPVVYFETVLYELLGNSHLANCTFVEVPRTVFNPHKSVQDAAGRSRRHWLAET